ncbi:serine hydrolase domain-containing protein [Catellatospora sp. KI3]|uniref:serine hydrolase domain-containing protein n=1 Tax=Catellatospora sp. KI3 TaxID=3041620 RepID=UPI0024831350|nr:serine hydrolase domain-containing protein [Catellatospora sp. KI3]MDI1465694.1 serine hydrolase domain-containing protein [Catellatospora sp. KI3]
MGSADLDRRLRGLIVAAGYASAERVVVGVDREGEITTAATHGSFTADTVAYTASVSKQVTGACLALLARRGALALDDPLARWLPELPGWAARIRLAHVLAHSGGLPGEERLWRAMRAAGQADRTTPGVLAALGAVERVAAPGLVHGYCNWGYVCLAEVAARAAGEPLPLFAGRELFGPLGMAATVLWSGPGPAPPGATPLPSRPAPLTLGDGGMWSTVADLLRWNRGIGADQLGTAQMLHTPGRLGDGTSVPYAMGVGLRTHRGRMLHSHGGAWPGVTAKLVRIAGTRRGLAVLALADGVDRMVALTDALTELLLEDDAPDGARPA